MSGVCHDEYQNLNVERNKWNTHQCFKRKTLAHFRNLTTTKKKNDLLLLNCWLFFFFCDFYFNKRFRSLIVFDIGQQTEIQQLKAITKRKKKVETNRTKQKMNCFSYLASVLSLFGNLISKTFCHWLCWFIMAFAQFNNNKIEIYFSFSFFINGQQVQSSHRSLLYKIRLAHT